MVMTPLFIIHQDYCSRCVTVVAARLGEYVMTISLRVKIIAKAVT